MDWGGPLFIGLEPIESAFLLSILFKAIRYTEKLIRCGLLLENRIDCLSGQ